MTDATPRLALPLLAAGQAQKELFHNEALAALNALVCPAAQTLGDVDPPADPVPGQSWIVGASPGEAWAGQAGTLATWTGGGWRFAAPLEGMRVWVAAAGTDARYLVGAWQLGLLTGAALTIGGLAVVGPRQPAIPAAAGGTTVDGEARATLAAVLAALRTHGLIASA